MFEHLLRQVADYRGDLVRNIKGIRVSQDLFDDLAGDAADAAVAIAAESATRISSPAPLITRPFDYGTVITYPFVPQNWHATRYSDGLRYGVWYGALELETTVRETLYHWHRFLTDSFRLDREIVGERRVFQVRCEAILIDLRNTSEPRLVERNDYRFTQQLGAYLSQRAQSGLLAPSARGPGTAAAILRPEALSEVRDLCYLTYRMNPLQDTAVVERTPGETWLRINIAA
ncbi:MAG TPA: RES family NAD+ phosphorylase [Burkholderiales bacterium]|nr:RES family NAD+ phosphorylase [Burkholderiales bacterium]